MTPIATRNPSNEETVDPLSIRRPLLFGIATFCILELLVAGLLFTQTGHKILPLHPNTTGMSFIVSPVAPAILG